MIEYSNIQRYDNIEFEDYLKLPGYSHSFLKSNVQGVSKYFNVTDKVTVGKIVDAILTEPAKADMSHVLYPMCKEIAHEIRKLFGDVIDVCEKQVSYTADMSINGLSMPVKGRLDFLFPNFAVLDLKITHEKNIDNLVQFMGYENQLWHYSKMGKVTKAFLMFYVVPLKKIIIRAVNVTNDYNEFWVSKIIDFGTAPSPEEADNSLSFINHVYPI